MVVLIDEVRRERPDAVLGACNVRLAVEAVADGDAVVAGRVDDLELPPPPCASEKRGRAGRASKPYIIQEWSRREKKEASVFVTSVSVWSTILRVSGLAATVAVISQTFCSTKSTNAVKPGSFSPLSITWARRFRVGATVLF